MAYLTTTILLFANWVQSRGCEVHAKYDEWCSITTRKVHTEIIMSMVKIEEHL